MRLKEKRKAIQLRKRGLSLNDISRRLDVAKSSVSNWVSGIIDSDAISRGLRAKWIKRYDELTADVDAAGFVSLAGSGASRWIISKQLGLPLGAIDYLASKLNIVVLRRADASFRRVNTSGKCSLCCNTVVGRASYCNTCVSRLRRFKCKKKCVEYKGGKCERCGWLPSGAEQYAALHFHHTADDKLFNISRYLGRGWSYLSSELDKCEMICANCHCIEHSKYSSLYLGL